MQSPESVRRRDRIPFTELEGETVLLNLKSKQYFVLNETGAFIWKLLNQERTIEELVREISEKFDVETEDARTDLMHLLEALEKAALIDWKKPTG